MIWAFAVAVFSLSSFAVARDGFPVGSYAGTGIKQFEDGRRLSYRLEMEIQQDRIAFVYHFTGTEPVKFALKMTFGKQGFFKVGTIGSGYCGDTSCYWSVQLGPNAVEQWTLVFSGNELFKTGSLVGSKGSNWWEERLTKR